MSGRVCATPPEAREGLVGGLLRRVGDLCRGDPARFALHTQNGARSLLRYVAVIALGAGVYGATIGLWRAPQQALYTAIKLPLLIVLTTTANALLNGMLAQGLGLRIDFRQTCPSRSSAPKHSKAISMNPSGIPF